MPLAQTLQEVMIRIVWLLTVLFLGIIAARTARTLIARAVIEARNRAIVKINAGLILSRSAEFIVYGITALLIANNLGVTKIVVIVVGAALATVLAINIVLHIIFALPNVIARWSVHVQSLQKGMHIEMNSMHGTIIKKGITQITVQSENNELLIIPFTYIIKCVAN